MQISGTLKLPLRTIVGYGVGDFAFNITFTFCSLFLLYFYTDVLGLSPTTAGLIIMLALIWDGITDPVAGIIANRTHSRWGRYRPWLLFGAVPLALSFIAMMLPLGLTGTSLTLYCVASHLVFRTVFTFVNIPYVALSAQITSDSIERGKLATVRMLSAMSCGVLLSALTLPIAKAFGGGPTGFFWVACIYGVISVPILLICFASTSEMVSARAVTTPQPNLRQLIGALQLNTPFLVLLAATVLGSIAFTMTSKALVYYMKYWVGSESAITLGLLTMLISASTAIVLWQLVTERTSKRIVWISGAAISVSAFATIYMLRPTEGWLLWVCIALTGAGNGAFALSYWSMLPDTVEYGEWRTGVRTEGPIFGFMMLSQKIALGVGTGSIGVLLDSIGYRANEAQHPATLDGLVNLYTLGPGLLFVAAACCIFFYPIDQAMHRGLVNDIAKRLPA